MAIFAATACAKRLAATLDKNVAPSLIPTINMVSTNTLISISNAVSPINEARSILFLISLNSQHPFFLGCIPDGHCPFSSTYTTHTALNSSSAMVRNSFSSTPA